MATNLEFINIPGPVGNLESVIHHVRNPVVSQVGIICHPHPLHLGSMHNKVVTTVAKALLAIGMPCIRFNFRGVGESDGTFDNAVGEIADCLAIISWAKNRWPNANICLAGFSFGAYIAAAAAITSDSHQLILVAPVTHLYDFNKLTINCPCLVIQGEADEIVPANLVYKWFDTITTKKTLLQMPAASHFFHSKLLMLYDYIKNYCLV